MAPPLGVPPNKVTGDLALDSPHPHIGTYDTPSEARPLLLLLLVLQYKKYGKYNLYNYNALR